MADRGALGIRGTEAGRTGGLCSVAGISYLFLGSRYYSCFTDRKHLLPVACLFTLLIESLEECAFLTHCHLNPQSELS